MIYRAFFRLVLQRLPAEPAHALALASLGLLCALKLARDAIRGLLRVDDAVLKVEALGQAFPNPLGVAGGLDKNAKHFDDLGALGFGFVEVGTVTSCEQKGHERPRVWRSVPDRAILNRMGCPNDGAHAIAKRLHARSGETIVGTSIGRAMSAASAGADYRVTATSVAPHSDFLVINVSSPNTSGLTETQHREPFRALVQEIRDGLTEACVHVPLLAKLSPDLNGKAIDEMADLAVELQLDGIVATNTTTSRAGLRHREWDERDGGVSGRPLGDRSLEVLRQLYRRTRGEIMLVSVGGIETPEQAWERITAGATLLQVHTGFVYGGPLWPRRMNLGLARLARAAGYTSVQAAVGSANDTEVNPDDPPPATKTRWGDHKPVAGPTTA